jgi:hypothetical protein
MSSLVLDVLKAWRDALRFVVENPGSPVRGALESRSEQLRTLYQRLTEEGGRLPATTAEADRLIQETSALLRDVEVPARAVHGEWY